MSCDFVEINVHGLSDGSHFLSVIAPRLTQRVSPVRSGGSKVSNIPLTGLEKHSLAQIKPIRSPARLHTWQSGTPCAISLSFARAVMMARQGKGAIALVRISQHVSECTIIAGFSFRIIDMQQI